MNQTVDPAVLAAVSHAFEHEIPFNRVLGLKIESMALDGVALTFDSRPEHIGNYVRGTLHGGVISSVLDTVGGLMAFLHALERAPDGPREEQMAALANVGTIDLRVDYLRAGRGESFRATASLMRAGSRVAVTRMELFDDRQRLTATGTGTYIIG